MKQTKNGIILLIFLLGILNANAQEKDLKLWYNAPAADWNEALPIGNGRLAAMIFGNPVNENIQLNEGTLWAGSPYRNDNPNAEEALPKIRELLFQGKFTEAHRLANAKIITKKGHGMPYETVGNLRLSFKDHNGFSNYKRELDIEKAVNTRHLSLCADK